MGYKQKRIGDKIYHTQAWRKLRQLKYHQEHGLCERCGMPGDIVHHKIYITKDNVDDPDITMNIDNLELLCIECHNKEHFEKNSPVRDGLGFDENGNLIQLDSK